MGVGINAGMDMGKNGGRPPYAAPLPALADLGDLTSHMHRVQFYGNDAFLLDDLSRFIGSALGAGDAGIVIATRAHRDGLARLLKVRGFDISLTAKEGRYVSLDAAETLAKFIVDGMPDEARFTEVIGAVITRAAATITDRTPRVAAFGEMVALLWAEGKPEAAMRLEQLWNGLAETHLFDLHCAYPMSLFRLAEDSLLIEEICATHSHVIPVESYTSLVSEDERLRAIALLQQRAQALETEIEERKKVQLSLERREAELSEAVAVRDIFLSVAAHELKTPITSLRGFAQLLLRRMRRRGEVSPELLQSALTTIELQTGKLGDLVERLLDSAQIEAGTLRIEPQRIDLVALVHSVLSQQYDDADHLFVFDGPEHLEAEVDPARFEQVIINLLDNAVKFSPEGGTVTVGLGRGDGEEICLTVTDEGMGIRPEQREQVFNRFHQAHGERHLSGIGLGLYIVRQIVELHGGVVRIEQPEHRGSRFVVALPSSAGDA